jgi:hypothetical protein
VWASFGDDDEVVVVGPCAFLRLIGVGIVGVPFGVNGAVAYVIELPDDDDVDAADDDVAADDVVGVDDAADGIAAVLADVVLADVGPPDGVVGVASAAIVPVAVVAAVEYEAESVALDLVTFEKWS